MTTSSPEPRAERLASPVAHPAPTPWAEARRRLEAGQLYWLSTEHPAGRPHVRPLLAVWLDDTLYFVAGPASHKARNLARNAGCSVAVAVSDAHLVVEGSAAIERDEAMLQRVAEAYASKYDWHVQVHQGAFQGDGAPTAGPPPYELYALRPTAVFGFGTTDTWSPTCWRF